MEEIKTEGALMEVHPVVAAQQAVAVPQAVAAQLAAAVQQAVAAQPNQRPV